jgi:V8-like Glu-specific endopeptidase
MKRVVSLIGRAVIAAALTAMTIVGSARAQEHAPVTSPLLGGEHVDLSNSPVALVATNNYICTGLLVGLQEVLTAAHCIAADASEFVVVVGGKKYYASQVFYNAAFKQDAPVSIANIQYDLGMIILKEPVTTVAPIAVLRDRHVSAGEPAAIFGYGTNETSGDAEQSILDWSKYGVVKISDVAQGLIASTHTSSKVSSCPGDSGGPLLQNLAGYIVSVGVVSSGQNDADKDGYCHLSEDGVSLFVDLQSSASQRFLANFPGVQYASGKHIILLDQANKLTPAVNNLFSARPGRALSSKAGSVARSFAKLRPYADDSNRTSLLKAVITSLKQAAGARSTQKARAAISRAANAVDSLRQLGIE